MSDFNPLEGVGRGCDTQLRVGGNLNALIEHFNMFNSLTAGAAYIRVFIFY